MDATGDKVAELADLTARVGELCARQNVLVVTLYATAPRGGGRAAVGKEDPR